MKLCFLVLFLCASAPAQQDDGPSFSCAHVTSRVNRLICTIPELAKLDRELALLFGNMRGQPIDQPKLRADEDAWLASLHRDCADAPCIRRRYQARIAALRDQSERAASPAAYQETRPFPVPERLANEAKALVGKTCSFDPRVRGPVIPGFGPLADSLPVTNSKGVVVAREKDGARFAFLVSLNPGPCKIQDVVALPAATKGNTFLQCSSYAPPYAGFGVRNPQTHGLYALWTIDAEKLQRLPMGVLGIETAVKCQQPEYGE